MILVWLRPKAALVNRSSADIPAKISWGRLSGMSCESRLNDSNLTGCVGTDAGCVGHEMQVSLFEFPGPSGENVQN
jgi:hypothetical protein